MMKNDNYINDIKNNSNLNEKEKKQIIEILKHSYETNLNAQYLKNVSESDISIYLDKNIKDTESVIEIKNAL
jgi:ribosomal protein S8